MCRGYQKQGQNQRKTSAAIPSTEDPGSLSMPYTYNYNPHLATMSYPASLQQSVVNVKVNNLFNANLLIDTGSSGSFIRKHFADKLGVQIIDCNEVITLASENQVSKAVGACYVNIELNDHLLENVRLLIIDQLCCDIIMGHDVLRYHSKLTIQFGGSKGAIELPSPSFHHPTICVLNQANIDPPTLFANLTENVHPIACSSRKFSEP